MEPMLDPSILALTAQTGLTLANFLPQEDDDDYEDTGIPEIQRVTKKTNVLPLWGNQTTMNLNPLVLENVRESYYYKNHLMELDNFQQLLDEVYYKVKHLEPWEKGTRKVQGMTGMCGGVRGVGAGGVVSSAFCILFRFFNLRINRRQLVSLINNSDSTYARGIGFMYIRFTQPPSDLWAWFEPYLDDEDEVDPRSGGGEAMTFGQLLRVMMTKLDWYGTLFPRIPVPIQKELDEKFTERKKAQWKDAARARRDREEFRAKVSDLPGFQTEDTNTEKKREADSDRPPEIKRSKLSRCNHHLRHHHCRKHRKHCPKKAVEERKAREAEKNDNSNEKPSGMAGNWCLIESDPGVFTELLKNFGVKGVQVEELYSLDESEFQNLRPIIGLIFLFKWRPGDEPVGTPLVDNREIFFAQQVIQNACATQALVNMLMNVDDPKVDLGNILTEYRDFVKDFDPVTKGLTLSNSDRIREVHNDFARTTQYELDIKGGREEDNYHFITYVPYGNQVLELDGMREWPLEVAQIQPGGDWLEAVRPVIQMRIQKYSEGEIHFNLMAVVTDRKEEFIRRIEALLSKPEQSAEDADVIAELQMMMEAEDDKMNRYKAENARRRHNYLPFLMELLKCLAKEGKLVPLMEQAQEIAVRRAKKSES